MFDHEKLDAYRLAIVFVTWAGTILDEKPRRGRPSVLRHLEESSKSRESHSRSDRLDGDETDRKAAVPIEYEYEYEYEYDGAR